MTETANNSAEKKTHHLLIVDDEAIIRESLVSYLDAFHVGDSPITLDTADSAKAARSKLAEKQYDLVISDINMPEEDGFQFLQTVHNDHPDTKTALITAYKVEDYIRNAKETGICNIIAKTAPFNFDELSSVVNNLLNPQSAFGMKHYMNEDAEIHEITVKSSSGIMDTFGTLQEYLTANTPQSVLDANPNTINDAMMAVIEALTNSVYHVAKNEDGTLKYEKGQQIEVLEPNEYVTVRYGKDSERVGISITDQGGRITADEVLYWLERNISASNLMDTHGRGVYLIHALIDRVLINIDPGECTEIIMLNYFTPDYRTNKPVYINQM